MQENCPFWTDPSAHMIATQPQDPVFYFSRQRLERQYERFRQGFPGLVTYAVKSNPHVGVISALVRAGMRAFDVASPAEMALVRSVAPEAVLHYHNPVRSRMEVSEGQRQGAKSWSVDRPEELAKLQGLPTGTEIAVRLKLPVAGAVYDFGSKFGADPAVATRLLRTVADMGFRPSITFHPGTQCSDPAAWEAYIVAAARVASEARVRITRLNVGGGFPAEPCDEVSKLSDIFARIDTATQCAFGPNKPDLVCEPGRAMVADCFALGLRVKARFDSQLFLNDGIYGGLSEWRDVRALGAVHVLSPEGMERQGQARVFDVFGPTCDSVDHVPGVALPHDIREDDFLVFEGSGAYGLAMASRFNGYGVQTVVPVGETCSGQCARRG